MKIEITGNPGTGNTFVDNHYTYIDNNFPNATTVNQYYSTAPPPPQDSNQILDDILTYVLKLEPIVSPSWKEKYRHLWQRIFAVPEVSPHLFTVGNQKHTHFNRQLVTNIIHILTSVGVFADRHPAHQVNYLEGPAKNSVVKTLGFDPDNKDITHAVQALIKTL